MDNISKRVILGLLLMGIIVLFVPLYWLREGPRQEATQREQRREAMAEGAHLYISFCAPCHGNRGQGLVGPALRNLDKEDELIFKTIARGVPTTAMPPWAEEEGGALKDHQIEGLVTLIKRWDEGADEMLEEEEAAIAAAAPAPTPTPVLPLASVGKTLFADKGCALCHGAEAQGDIGPKLLGKEASLVREAVRAGRHPIMPEFTPHLVSDEDLEALIAFLAATPTPQATPPAEGMATQGKALYSQKGCAVCHGAEGQGGVGPALKGKDEAAIQDAARKGRPPIMPAFGEGLISQEELQKIVAYIKSL